MNFTLTYDGALHSQRSSNIFRKKWEIRQQLAPQLAELWRVQPGLRMMNRWLPDTPEYLPKESYHLIPSLDNDVLAEERPPSGPIKYIDLLAPIDVSGIRFCPLVRDSLALSCSLRILFMRKEEPGNVYVGGDLDNRIKTFLDALKVPKSEADSVARVSPKPTEPILCLMQDDSLITGLAIETARLLTSDGGDRNFVRLVVDVKVQVVHPRHYNELFLGA